MNSQTTGHGPGGQARSEALASVEFLERTIRRRDHRIRELSDALERETRVSATLRDEVTRLGARLADLEQALRTPEHAPDTGPYARAAAVATPDGGARHAGGIGSNAVAPPSAYDGVLPGGRCVATLDELMGRTRYGSEARADVAAGEPVQYDESRFAETQPDVPYELLSPDLMLDSPAPPQRARPAPVDVGTCGALVSIDDAVPVTLPITKDSVTVGRSELSDISIDNPLISRLHARIRSDSGRVWIEDLGSKNGVMVNSQRVERCELTGGDLVNIGRVRFRYVSA